MVIPMNERKTFRRFKLPVALLLAALTISRLDAVEPEIKFYLPADTPVMGQVQYLDYGTLSKRHFIRTEIQGRFLEPEEAIRLIATDYIERINNSDRWDAVLSSLLYFDRGAEYRYYHDSQGASAANWESRWLKLSALFVAGLAYLNMSAASEEYSRSLRYFNDSVPEKRFNRARTYYHTALAATASIWAYEGCRAYQDFGTSTKLGDLRIQERTIVDSSTFFKDEADNLGYRIFWSFQL